MNQRIQYLFSKYYFSNKTLSYPKPKPITIESQTIFQPIHLCLCQASTLSNEMLPLTRNLALRRGRLSLWILLCSPECSKKCNLQKWSARPDYVLKFVSEFPKWEIKWSTRSNLMCGWTQFHNLLQQLTYWLLYYIRHYQLGVHWV